MEEQIRIYFQNNPLLSNQGNNFTIGFIDNTGALIPINNNDALLSIIILEPSDGQIVNNNSTIIVSPRNSNITLRLKITYSGITQYFSFLVVPPIVGITLNNIYNRLQQVLPKNVYSKSTQALTYADDLAAATTIYQLYDSGSIPGATFSGLNKVIEDFYPISGYSAWEDFLTGSNRLLYQDVTQYGLLLQHIYQCEINNNTNPYWAVFNISKYIYLWLGITKFVYIEESIIRNVNDAFIMNQNSLGESMLINAGNGDSDLIVIYVCSDGASLSLEQQLQINQFARQITRAGMKVSIIYNKSLADLDLNIYLNNTYHTDPRQNQIFCIQYNQGVLDEALGYTSSDPEIFEITAFELIATGSLGDVVILSTTSTNILLLSNTPYKITSINTTPAVMSFDPTNFIEYFSSDITLLDLLFDGTEENLVLNNIGTGITLNAYLATITNTYDITIS